VDRDLNRIHPHLGPACQSPHRLHWQARLGIRWLAQLKCKSNWVMGGTAQVTPVVAAKFCILPESGTKLCSLPPEEACSQLPSRRFPGASRHKPRLLAWTGIRLAIFQILRDALQIAQIAHYSWTGRYGRQRLFFEQVLFRMVKFNTTATGLGFGGGTYFRYVAVDQASPASSCVHSNGCLSDKTPGGSAVALFLINQKWYPSALTGNRV